MNSLTDCCIIKSVIGCLTCCTKFPTQFYFFMHVTAKQHDDTYCLLAMAVVKQAHEKDTGLPHTN
jgi:hypothetical protein